MITALVRLLCMAFCSHVVRENRLLPKKFEKVTQAALYCGPFLKAYKNWLVSQFSCLYKRVEQEVYDAHT